MPIPTYEETQELLRRGDILGTQASVITDIPYKPVASPLVEPPKVISDTTDIRKDIYGLSSDITKGLEEFGITQPTFDIDKILSDYGITGLRTRQEQLGARKIEDISQIEKSFGTAEEQLKLQQEEALAKAEGRTRIGGFFTQLEAKDILNLQRGHRIEVANLQNQRQQTLQTAKRAYEDQDYQLARDQVEMARNIEKDIEQKRQDYFNNVIKAYNFYQTLNKPIIEATEADQAQMLDIMQTAPSAFKDIKPSDIMLGKLTYADVLQRYLDSDEYEAGMRVGEKAPASVEEFNYLKKNKMIPEDWSYLQYQQYKATQYGTERVAGEQAYSVGDQKVSSLTLDIMGGLKRLSDLSPTQYEEVSSDLRKLGFYSNEPPAWFKDYIEKEQPEFLTGLTDIRVFQKLANLWEATRQEVISTVKKETTISFGEGSTPSWLVIPSR